MVRGMAASGVPADPAWRAAFEEVPRHLFVPYYYADGSGGGRLLWSGDPDPVARGRWLRGAYADTALATRMRDGRLVSSSSQPSLMAGMLDELDVRDGDRVLEVGAGTGYNAALLAHRLGDGLVTTVDLDPEITESARAHLAASGHRPAVVTGDGARGCPQRAPFDRIIATCALPSVPHAWVDQCAPGARILTPLATGLLSLRVTDGAHGRAAQGRFLYTAAYFVALRGAVAAGGDPEDVTGGVPRHALRNDLFQFLLALSAGALEPEEAYALWRRERRPDRDRYGVTVTPDAQWAWLDDPGGPHTWPLRGA
ncbi:methyltransferase domain-containing protein [Streptomyces montanisoli]|uniref:Protein-L-isoaspartate O-methyltransferase n=1 Tax=Streptomyces montanisoli TaxID=2798581 RepID=A0A940RXY5_9ACTN|nr:methyltransferase domain-containing protein [Streptomyces montanisoli]MBP0461050.1 methyltransferase domain-containing protein [Streptomyces montanisoli]